MSLISRNAAHALLFALALSACAESPSNPVVPEPPESVPQQDFGTSGDDAALSVSQGADFILVGGRTAGALDGVHLGGNDAFVRLYHPEGALLWSRQFGTHLNDAANAVLFKGAAWVVGETDGSMAGSRGDRDAFIRKYDIAGQLLWERQFGTAAYDAAFAITVDQDGFAYVAGATNGPLGGPYNGGGDGFLRKYSPTGDVVWTKQIGTSAYDFVSGVTYDGSFRVYIVGTTSGNLRGVSAGETDAFVRKYDLAGETIWTRQFGTTSFDYANGIAVLTLGDPVVVGSTQGPLQGAGAGGQDVFYRRYSADGAALITKQFGSPATDNGYAIVLSGDGDVYISGSAGAALTGSVSLGGADAFVRKYSAADNQVFTRQFGTATADAAYGIGLFFGDALAAGTTFGALAGSNRGSGDAYLRRFDLSGNTLWTDQ
jgi:hypothetical protein